MDGADGSEANNDASLESVRAADAPPGGRSRLWHFTKLGAAITVGLATIASLAVAWLQLRSQLEQIEAQTRPPVIFDRRINDYLSAKAFVSFATDNDYQVRRVNLECLLDEGQGACVWGGAAVAGDSGDVVLFMSTKPGCRLTLSSGRPTGTDCVTHWVHVRKNEQFDAQVDNGEYGAGNIVVRGYFAISLRNALGSAPPSVKHVFLRAVAPEMVGQR